MADFVFWYWWVLAFAFLILEMLTPGFFFMWLAKREDRFIPDEAKRKLYARSLIVGSIAVALLIAWLRS